MSRLRSLLASVMWFSLVLSAQPAEATLTLPLSVAANGSDGALNVTSQDVTIDLSLAVTGQWDQVGTGVGVYDPTKWAVVFKYSSINIAAGRTVRFTNHPSGAPVVWIVQGKATIVGTVNLDGENGNDIIRPTVPGPGGFAGGRGSVAGNPGTAGFGPGGGAFAWESGGWGGGSGSFAGVASVASIAGATYGNPRIIPLIGGSGGSGHVSFVPSGGAGGGAILIVAASRLDLGTAGVLRAQGGSYRTNSYSSSGEGSGGAIRVVADTLSGSGTSMIYAHGWNNTGGIGRIRLECNTFQWTNQSAPAYSLLAPLGVEGVVLWPPASSPTVVIATVNGSGVTSDPKGDLVLGDLTLSATSAVPVTLAATNVPTNSTVTVRVVLGSGAAYSVPATLVSGDATASTWGATLTSLSPAKVSAIQAKVIVP